METIVCICCDEYETRGKSQIGYCVTYMKPTWKSTVRQCQEDVRREVGDFCYYHCPFRCDFDCGQLCGEESPSITGIDECPELQSRINEALGGEYEYYSISLNENGEVVENYCSIRNPFESWVNERMTAEFRYFYGWFPHHEISGDIDGS